MTIIGRVYIYIYNLYIIREQYMEYLYCLLLLENIILSNVLQNNMFAMAYNDLNKNCVFKFQINIPKV